MTNSKRRERALVSFPVRHVAASWPITERLFYVHCCIHWPIIMRPLPCLLSGYSLLTYYIQAIFTVSSVLPCFDKMQVSIHSNIESNSVEKSLSILLMSFIRSSAKLQNRRYDSTINSRLLVYDYTHIMWHWRFVLHKRARCRVTHWKTHFPLVSSSRINNTHHVHDQLWTKSNVFTKYHLPRP